MFESSVLPRQANKAALADALWEEVKNGQPESVPEGQLHTVIDGGGCSPPSVALATRFNV